MDKTVLVNMTLYTLRTLYSSVFGIEISTLLIQSCVVLVLISFL